MVSLFNPGAWLKLTIAVSVFVQAEYAQGEATKYDGSEVKLAIEEAAVLNVCPDRALLKFAKLEVSNCRDHISKFAPVCWHQIDRVATDYKIEQGEKGRKRFISILTIYTSCVRAELLKQLVKSSKESD